MKKITHTNGIRIVLFATFLLISGMNLHAQYKLELGWQKDTEWITSITKSDNDSLLYVAFQNLIITVKTSDGSIVKSDSVDGSYNLKMSKDGKTLVAAYGSGVGMLDPNTFKRIYWDDTKNSDYLSLSLNEKQNKFVICGNSNLIRVYDIDTKSIFKDLSPKYFENGTKILKNISITDDGKYIIYGYLCYTENPTIIHYYLKMMDMEGNLVKDLGETSSTNYTLTNDGKTIIYFKSDAIHFFDLETMEEKEIIPSGGLNPAGIEMSRDGKIMLLGFTELSKITNSLIYCDLEAKNYFILQPFGSWEMFRLNKDNSSIFSFVSDRMYKFNIVPTTSISSEQNKLDWTIQVLGNNLFLKSTQELKTSLTYKIISADSKTVKTFLPNEAQIISKGIQFDISNLQSGAYFLQISDNQNIISILKFLKAN